MKYAKAYEIFASQMLRGEFYFIFCESKIFHNPKDYFISRSDISLYTMLRIDLFSLLCYNTPKFEIFNFKYSIENQFLTYLFLVNTL